jgi:BON domain-containing protein
MNRSYGLAAGLTGAVLMFFLDPVAGRRRRALVRDRFVREAHRTQRYGRAAGHDLTNRLTGMASQLTRAGATETVQSDDTMAANVRTAFGRVVTHPGAIHVTVRRGVVDLDGAVLSHELAPLIDAIAAVQGVVGVNNRLRVSDQAGHIPGLQGNGTPPRRRVRHLVRAPGIQLAALTAVSATAVALLVTRRLAEDHRAPAPL